jgi:soluble lytic murein transglycosylase-like protein
MLREVLPKFGANSLLKPFAGRLDAYIGPVIGHSQRIGVDPLYVAAIILVESEGIPTAFNARSKATGLIQVLPREAVAVYGDHAWLRARPTIAELKQPEINVRWGCDVLQDFLRQAGGNVQQALYRYSGGDSWLDRGGYAAYIEQYWARVVAYRQAMIALASSGDLEALLLHEAEQRVAIQFNPQAAQRVIFAQGFVPNSPEFEVAEGEATYVAQRAERLSDGVVRVFYVKMGDWGNVRFVERGAA